MVFLRYVLKTIVLSIIGDRKKLRIVKLNGNSIRTKKLKRMILKCNSI